MVGQPIQLLGHAGGQEGQAKEEVWQKVESRAWVKLGGTGKDEIDEGDEGGCDGHGWKGDAK
jgi:hypothetical protein